VKKITDGKAKLFHSLASRGIEILDANWKAKFAIERSKKKISPIYF
jgi:hypothetical protein